MQASLLHILYFLTSSICFWEMYGKQMQVYGLSTCACVSVCVGLCVCICAWSNSYLLEKIGQIKNNLICRSLVESLSMWPDLEGVKAWNAKTKYHNLDGLDNRHLFPTVLKVWKSKINMDAASFAGKSSFPTFQTVTLSIFMWWTERTLLSWQGHYSQSGGSTHMTSYKPNHLPKA